MIDQAWTMAEYEEIMARRKLPRDPVEHELKTEPPYFQDVLDGKKSFDVRLADRDFRKGDTLCLREFIPRHDKLYTGRELRVRVSYIYDGLMPQQLPPRLGYVVMGILPILPPDLAAELQPCPFCDSRSISVHENDWCEPSEWDCVCESCRTRGPGRYSRIEAVALWNTRTAALCLAPRTPSPDLQVEVEREAERLLRFIDSAPIERINRARNWAAEYKETVAGLLAALTAERERTRVLGECLKIAEAKFREYGDLHAAKPDMVKAQRNYDIADRMRAALSTREP